MSGKAKIEAVGITLIVVVLVHNVGLIVLLESSDVDLDPKYSMIRSALVRVPVFWILSCALLAKTNWARILLGLLCLLTTLFAVITWLGLPAAGGR